MSVPEDRSSGATPPEPPKSSQPYLPPRLRDKLTSGDSTEEEWHPKKPGGFPSWAVWVIIIVVAGAVGWWFLHNQQVKAKAKAAAEAARAAAVADSVAKVKMADSLAMVARADSIEAFKKLPPAQQQKILAEQAKALGEHASPEQKAALAAVSGPWALDTGEFLFKEKADAAAADLKTKTGLPAKVVPVGDTYHVYVGRYDARSAADAAAVSLSSKGLVPEARVVKAR